MSEKKGLKSLSWDEIAQHNTINDGWVVIDNLVYDLSKFAKFHPGGQHVLLEHLGKDATRAFFALHRVSVLEKYQRLVIGQVRGSKPRGLVTKNSASQISRVPHGETPYWQGYKSPYFKDSHLAMRKELRAWVAKNLTKDAQRLNKQGKPPTRDTWKKVGQYGILAARIGPGPHLKFLPQCGVPRLPGGVTAEEFDYFHEMIAHEELTRMGAPGYQDGIGAGLVIGLPPLLLFGKKPTVMKYAPSVLNGSKIICLAISEPFAGSDVANIKCTATKTPDGKHYIVNGTKKWITNGNFSDYFVTAVRTGGKGIGGISLLMIERSEGLETELIKTSYSTSAGTAYVTYDNVKVPVENLLGEENQGFRCIMYNFNHERWLIIVAVLRGCRSILDECFRWAKQREVFGKALIKQPVIRFKLARMAAQLESTYAWLETITYQMCKMTYAEQAKKLAGPIALLKYQATRVSLLFADEAAQIFGGRAITRSGMGGNVEHFIRSVKYGAILGGSEEIMADLGVRQAMRSFPKDARL